MGVATEEKQDADRPTIGKRLLGAIGPGLITAAVVLGPGSITVSSKCGALMGYSVLWVVVLAVVLMIAFTSLGARIGMVTPTSFLTVTAERHGRWVAVLLGLCGFLITTGFQTGNNVGVGLALSEMFGGSMGFWAVVFTAVALIMMWSSSSLYRALERMMVVLVALMIVCFLGNLTMIRPDAREILIGLVPSKPAVFALVTAISATTFSVAAAAFQPYLVRAKGWGKQDLSKGFRDSAIGISMLGLISAVIMITASTVLRPAGIKVSSAVDMARQLEPLLGSASKWLFLLGLWAGAFSSFIVNAMIGGTVMADGLGIGDRLESRSSKALASGVMLLGTLVALLCGGNPIQLIVVAQGTTILGVPLIAVVMWRLGCDTELMGEHRTSPAANTVLLLGIAWLLFLSVRQLLVLMK